MYRRSAASSLKEEAMKIGIIGSGHVGGTVGALWAKAGHRIMFSSRHPDELGAIARQTGAQVGSIGEAATFSDVVLISVPWAAYEAALAQAGPLTNMIVIDTTNQFGAGGVLQLPGGVSAAGYHAEMTLGAHYTKAYNTLTAGFQASSAGRTGPDRIAMPYCAGDAEAKRVVAQLIEDSGFAPFEVDFALAHWMEPPRRPGAFYGEDWTLATAQALLDQIKGQPRS
jgi:8-hydroxy-5-deazaflavin:NADPH oxidoreductase